MSIGIGLLVASKINRVIINICQTTPHDGYCVMFKQDFENVSPSVSKLTFRRSVALSCDRIYLIVVTMEGGASFVGQTCNEDSSMILVVVSVKEPF